MCLKWGEMRKQKSSYRDIRVNLTCGHLFRPITSDWGIKDAPFTSSAAESRLKGYLKEMNADNGERSVVSAPAVRSL